MENMTKKEYANFLAVEMCNGNVAAKSKLIQEFIPIVYDYVEATYSVDESEQSELTQDAMMFITELMYNISKVGVVAAIPEDIMEFVKEKTFDHISKAYETLMDTGIINLEEKEVPTFVPFDVDEIGKEDTNLEEMIERNSFLFTLASLDPIERRIFILLMKGLSREGIAIATDLSDKELDEFIENIKDKTSKNYFDEFVGRNPEKGNQKSL